MYTPLTLRITRARRNAIHLREQRSGTEVTQLDVPEDAILSLLGAKLVVECSDGLIITEAGFITMALLSSHARYCQGLLVIPGVDDKNQFGYLVVRDGHEPFHSLTNSIGRAAVEAQRAWEQSSRLVQHFGGRSELKRAVASAPWYLISKVEDAYAAGLCQWGVDSFLRRLCLRRISLMIGLPTIALRVAGAYGRRVTAATLVRQEHASSKAALTHDKDKMNL